MISQPLLPPQAPSNPSQTITQTPAQLASTSGKTPSPAAGSAARNYASAVGGAGQSQHARSDTVSSVNGRNPIVPAVPTVDSPNAANGGNVGMSSNASLGDHSRKSSVTISATGPPGYMLNGGPVAGKPTGGNGIQFGAFNPDRSPALPNATPQMNQSTNSLSVNNPNPRITSPTSSPSPIPQPPASGGRPPSSFQGQGNNVNFGTINGEDPNVSCFCTTPFFHTDSG